ncbi:hypothetical protein HALO153_10108 [Vreelandella titanicae]|nr:hypothetical protein HALO156_10032 [Halomonas sp. 156]VXA97602.1 hypothetical protein HALO153_10108 [Halomonas titanicae]
MSEVNLIFAVAETYWELGGERYVAHKSLVYEDFYALLQKLQA